MLTLDQFTFAVNNCTSDTVAHIDNQFCNCGYIAHWVFRMDRGRWNPLLNEMDCELREVKTVEELYTFLLQKHDL